MEMHGGRETDWHLVFKSLELEMKFDNFACVTNVS